jgi:two-component sensor histidine kinase
MSTEVPEGIGPKRRTGSARRLGIRAYLVLLISLAIVAPLSTYAVLGGFFINSFFEREFTARGETVVRGVAGSSLAFMRSAVAVVVGIAEDERFFGIGDPVKLKEHLGAKLALHPEFESFVCIDARGVQIASSPPDPNDDGLDLSDRDYAKPLEGVPLVSESYISSSSGRPVVSISVRPDRSSLAVVGSLDLSLLSDFVAQSVGPDWTLEIADGSGTIIADRDQRRVQERANIGNLIRGGEAGGTTRVSMGEGSPIGAFSRRLGEYGWSVVASYDPAAFLVTINRIRSSALAFAILAFAILGAIALFMARRILGDLDLLRSGVRAIRDRHYGDLALEPAFIEFRELIGDVRSMESAVEEREAQLTDMVRQRDTLLREVHHRVKNNMQIISSLLSLQKDTMVDSEAAIALTESSSRVQALALVHEFLYRGEDFSRIRLGDYFRELCSSLIAAYGAQGVQLLYKGDPIELEFDRAIPIGLVMNEIVTNSLKHAFRGRSGGKITLTLGSSEEGIDIFIADDGPGFGSGGIKRSLGFQLIDSLISQLGGSMKRTIENGTAYSIVLPI